MCLPVVLGALFIMSQAGAQPPATPVNRSAPVIDDQTCLSCHSDAGLSLTAHDGTALSLHIAQDALAKSVHAKIACADCHTGMAEIPHPERSFASRREVALVLDAQCRRCHFSNYEDARQRAPAGRRARR